MSPPKRGQEIEEIDLVDALVTIDPELREAAPELRIGVLRASVTVSSYDPELSVATEAAAGQVRSQLKLDKLSTHPEIAELRRSYRALGRDPQRYRGSAEALLRRILQGKPLYQINTVVDTNNLISVRTGKAVGTYDLDQVSGPVAARVGTPDESYESIGKGALALGGLPVFADLQGPFGSPTSDSVRTMIRPATQRILLMLLSFAADEALQAQLAEAADFLQAYSAARDVDCYVTE